MDSSVQKNCVPIYLLHVVVRAMMFKWKVLSRPVLISGLPHCYSVLFKLLNGFVITNHEKNTDFFVMLTRFYCSVASF